MNVNNYTSAIIFRVTETEKLKIKRNAQKCGLNISNFIRKKTLESSPIFLSESDRKEILELKKVGLEMNRTLNLYHEKRTEHSPFFKKLRKVISKHNP